MTSGIYTIRNTKNGKVYVGQTTDLKDRQRRHFTSLAKNSHPNKHLQTAYNEYGKSAFVFVVLEVVELPTDALINRIAYREFLKPYEQKWMDFYGASDRDRGYNLAPAAGTNLGVERSQATREKLSQVNKGKTLSAETKRKISESGKGHGQTPETRLKISATKSNRTYIVITASGEEFPIVNLKQFCRERDLNHGEMLGILKGERASFHRGYSVRHVTDRYTE